MEFEALYRRHVQAVLRFALSITRRRDLAEDLTSEAFLALHRELMSIDQAQLPGWLLTVVRNLARDMWRHRLVEERHAERESRTPISLVDPPPLEDWILRGAGNAYVNALAESMLGLFKTEMIRRKGPWRSLEAGECATLVCVDWFDNQRLFGPPAISTAESRSRTRRHVAVRSDRPSRNRDDQG